MHDCCSDGTCGSNTVSENGSGDGGLGAVEESKQNLRCLPFGADLEKFAKFFMSIQTLTDL